MINSFTMLQESSRCGLQISRISKPERSPAVAESHTGFSGKDKAGPSKGGFLNDRLFSHTVLYLCNEIIGVYQNNRLLMKIIDYSGNHLY